MSATITTQRLLLNPLAITDSSFILELVNTKEWLTFIGDRNVYTNADAKVYIQKIIDDPNKRYWVVRFSNNNAPMGVVTFIKRDYSEFHDIGCAFLPSYTNNGYAYEGTSAVLEHIIQAAQFTRISSITTANNIRSIKLLNKLGLEFIRTIENDDESLQLYEASVDRILIAGLTKSFFSAFTNKGNAKPDLDILAEICIPEILIADKRRSKVDIFDLTTFIRKTRSILTDGTLIDFEEKEVSEETKVVNGIAVRYSQYEKKGIVYRQRFKIRGHKMFQFVKLSKAWKISSILWEDEEN
ncbi:MAG TPA: GNAT family N-acetyltransferase [Chitinophagaceae bacterium]|nr:GNAT family N-acetyltransferase [Chitinophagaceae bacterium]